MTIRFFCEAEKLSLCKRGRQWFTVFCLAEREHAERFMVRFGGEMIDPKNGRGGRAQWHAVAQGAG